MIEPEVCIQCGHVAGHASIMIVRPRPMKMGEYQLCLPCARRIRKEQDARAQEAIRVAERSGV